MWAPCDWCPHSPCAQVKNNMWLQEVEIHGDQFPSRADYPFNIPVLRSRQSLTFGPVSFLVGENGCGKSTLMEAVARRCGIHIWAEPKRTVTQPADRRIAAQSGSLGDYLRLTLTERSVRGGFFSAETFRDRAEFLDDVSTLDPGQARYHGGAGLTLRSHGEGLLAYFRGRYQIPGLYFLDEPEAALSPANQLELLRVIHRFRTTSDAQFIVATHSPILMALPGARVFDFSGPAIEEIHYADTGHYQIYKDFMADPQRFLEM